VVGDEYGHDDRIRGRFPVTLEGRLNAFALMLVGVPLVGVVTASVAAWVVANVERPADRSEAGLRLSGGPKTPLAASPAQAHQQHRVA